MALAHTLCPQPGWRPLAKSVSHKINLRMTLCGGQCFHWHPTPRHTFVGAVGHEVFELREAHCRKKTAFLSARNAMSKDAAKPSLGTSAATSAQGSGGAGDVCCWVEYRRLWPPAPREEDKKTSTSTAMLDKKAAAGAQPTTEQQSRDAADDDLLSWYLSLDVDLAALWERWTDTPNTREHRLVAYLIGNRAEVPTQATSKRTKSAALSRVCEHDVGGGAGSLYIPIRHVRQDVHSCLFSFLCSQNNNVSRITSMIYSLSRHHGDHLCDVKLDTGEVRPPPAVVPRSKTDSRASASRSRRQSAACQAEEAKVLPPVSRKSAKNGAAEPEWFSLYSFPTTQQLAAATDEKLRQLGFGYRSKYVVEAVRTVTDFALTPERRNVSSQSIPPLLRRQHSVCLHDAFYLDLIAHYGSLSYQRAQLESLCGVGRKVADCVLLFSLSHANLVPVDTHMAQVAVEYLATGEVEAPRVTPTRKRQRSDGAAAATDAAGRSWQQELLLWGLKAQKMKAEASKKAKGGSVSKEKKTKGEQKNVKKGTVAGREKEEDAKLPVPALSERHHDAIQRGFTELFGAYAGWAHSILFYYRMRK